MISTFTDKELRDSGWTEEEIAQQRLQEKKDRLLHEMRRDDEERTHRYTLESLDAKGKLRYDMLTMSGMSRHRAASVASAEQQKRIAQETETFIRSLDKRWWQFWKK